MIEIYFWQFFAAISILWVIVRAICVIKQKSFSLKRESALLLVYICFIVLARITFFPLMRVEGALQPLIFDLEKAWPFRINIIPLKFIFDYPALWEILANIIGNVAMFIPVGIIWPSVFKKLDRPWKVISAGVGLSLFIEIMQLPFYERASDIDDLILNGLGFLIGYGIYLLHSLNDIIRTRF